jgi:protein-S-isoprenylcysteine O-methyltransferase Ste14
VEWLDSTAIRILAKAGQRLSHLIGSAGLWIVFERANLTAILLAAFAVLGTAIFVVLYEEPTLRKKFGAEYDEYCRHIRRWIPRLHVWEK